MGYFKVCQKYQFGTYNSTKMLLEVESQAFEKKVQEVTEAIEKSVAGLFLVAEGIQFSSKVDTQPNVFDKLGKAGDINICDTLVSVEKSSNTGKRPLT